MSIQNEIERITNAVSNTYDTLEEMGATMPENRNVDNLPMAARTIPVGGSGYDMIFRATGLNMNLSNFDKTKCTISKGSASDVLAKIKNGEPVKAGIFLEYMGSDDSECLFVESSNVHVVGDLDGADNFTIAFERDASWENSIFEIYFNGQDLENNTITDAWYSSVNYDAKLSMPTTDQGSWTQIDRGTVGQFAVSDGKGGITWLTVNNGNEVAY